MGNCISQNQSKEDKALKYLEKQSIGPSNEILD